MAQGCPARYTKMRKRKSYRNVVKIHTIPFNHYILYVDMSERAHKGERAHAYAYHESVVLFEFYLIVAVLSLYGKVIVLLE